MKRKSKLTFNKVILNHWLNNKSTKLSFHYNQKRNKIKTNNKETFKKNKTRISINLRNLNQKDRLKDQKRRK